MSDDLLEPEVGGSSEKPQGDWRIAEMPDASAPECDLVRQWLREHNWVENPGFMQDLQKAEARPLVLLSQGEAGVLAGLLAETQLSWLRISILAVDPDSRSNGLGGALLAEAERQAVARGCKYAYVDSMEYHAPGFYLAHGYAIAGQIPDWDSHGHSKFYFTKHLA